MKHLKKIYISLILFFFVSMLMGIRYENGYQYKTPIPIVHGSELEESVISNIYKKDNGIGNQIVSFQHRSILLDKSFNKTKFDSTLHTLKNDESGLITILIPDSSAKNCLDAINDGMYDEKIKLVSQLIHQSGKSIYIRLNPSIEVPVHLYSWQYQSPVAFIKAFRRFSSLCKKEAQSTKIVWGTDGYPGAEEYWPGDDVVDWIGITIYSKSEALATAYPPVSDPVVMLRRKIHRMRFMNKPILFLNADPKKDDETLRIKLLEATNSFTKDMAIVYNTAVFTPMEKSVSLSARRKPVVGVYDPKKLILNLASIGVEHLFVDVKDIKNGYFKKEFDAIMNRGHNAIITVEPFKDTESTVLQKTIDGVYDNEFRELYTILSKAEHTIYLRFAHEMEIPIHRYPWQSQDPVLYIKAFRYFMTFEGRQSANIKKVWGPAGDRGSMEWWPGDDVVDYISIAIYGLPDKNITDPKQQESFSTIYSRKSYRMRFASKPIFITEFGVKGEEDFQMKWLKDAAHCITTHPEISGVCYFNLADNPKVWGNIPAPDWSVSKQTFTNFTRMLAYKR